NPPVEMAFDAENAAEIDFRALGLPREDDIITWSTELDYPRGAGTELYIDRQGIVYPDQNALALGNDGQGVPTRYIVKAIFEGETVERKITITPFDVVTGAESEVAYIRILGKDEIIPDVFQWGKGNVGLYNLDGEFAHPAVYNLPDAFHNNYYLWVYYDDGRIRNKTSVASFSANDPRVQKRGVNYFSIPFTESSGGSVTITAFYSEGAGVSHQTAITLPVTTHEFKSLDLSARITPGGVLFAQNNQGVNLWANAYDADAPYQAYLVGYVEFYTPDKTQYYRSNEVLNIDVSSQNSLWSTSHETLESVGNFSVSGGSQLLYPIVQGERGALEPVFNPDELVGAHIRGIYKGDVIPEIIEGDMQVQMDFDIIDEVDRKVDFQVIPGTGTFLIEGNWLYLVEDNIGVRPKEIYARSDGGPVNTRHPDIEHEENYNYSWQDDQGQLDPPDTYGSFTAIQHWGDQDPVRILTYQATNQNEFEGLSREVSRYVMGMTDFDAGPKPTPPIETALAERVDDPICFGHSPDPSSSNFDPDFDQWDLGDFAGGTGFPDDPYLICTVGQLRNHQEIAREKILAEDTRNGSRYRGGPGRCDIPGDWSHLQEDWERVRYCHRNHFKLMANLDFITEGNSLEPIKIRNLDGNGYQIRNFSSIEETGEASVFRSKDYMNIRNLILKNIYLKGQQAGVFSARGITPLQRVVFEDVHLLDSQVWGEFNTGGFISVTKSAVIIEGSSVRDTDIAFERGNAGGFIGKAWDGSGGGAIIRDSFVKANLELAGVQGNYAYVGGLVGDMQKTTLLESDVGIRNPLDLDRIELHPGYASQFIDRGIYNSFFEGEITTGHSLQDERSRSGVGGLVGLNGPAPIVHSFTRNAYIVTSGAKAGGLVGESMANSRYWYHGVMAHNKVIGGAIWGGSGQRESFEGGLELPGPSNAGGIVGLSHGGMILDNEVSCTTIKGVTNVGGVVGKADSYKHRIYRNTSSAKVRSSEGFHGGFIGSAPQEVRQDFPNGQTYEKRIFFEDNDWDTVNAPSVEDLGLLRASNEKPVLGVHNAFGVNTDYREVCPTDVGL
ncbi:MAG TPA: hypothetical protein VIT68_04370, partial [Candidatus Gracilibacteria bacterium]